MRRFIFPVLTLLGLLIASPAYATAEFPGIIVAHLAITCDGGADPIWDSNGCTICHTSNNGGLGTATHPLGTAFKMEGLSPFADGELTKLLDLETQPAPTGHHDFNCDGIPDIDQLTGCDWPALAITGTMCGDAGTNLGDAGATTEAVIYGCSTSTTSGTLPASVATGIAGLMLVALVRRRITARKQTR
jgi:MYXO-CTERM domain-containing protein